MNRSYDQGLGLPDEYIMMFFVCTGIFYFLSYLLFYEHDKKQKIPFTDIQDWFYGAMESGLYGTLLDACKEYVMNEGDDFRRSEYAQWLNQKA